MTMDGFSAWHAWLLVAVLLWIGEAFTPTFLLGTFGIGAAVTAVAAALEWSATAQVAVFAAATALSLGGLRPWVLRRRAPAGAATGTDALVGVTAVVSRELPLPPDAGEIKAGGEFWRARLTAGPAVPVGGSVRILRIEGVTAVVEPVSGKGVPA